MKAVTLAIPLLAATLPVTGAEVFRCVVGSSVSYQEFPCADGMKEVKLDLPQSFPEVNTEGRNRLSQREAALDARLEAERERLSREEIARKQAAAQVASAQALASAPTEPVYYAAYPYWRPYARNPARPVNRNPMLLR